MLKTPGSKKLLASAVAAALLPAAGLVNAAPTGTPGAVSLIKEVTSPVLHCNSADLVTGGKCAGSGPNRYRVTYAYWVQNLSGAAANVQIYDDIQKEFGTGATIPYVTVASAQHSPGGLYDIDPTQQFDAAGDPVATPTDDDGDATTAATADDDDAINATVNTGFEGTTGGNIALLAAAQNLPKNKMLAVVVTFEVVLPTPLPTMVSTEATLGDGTEATPTDTGNAASSPTLYMPAQVKTTTLGSTGCATGNDPVGSELVENGDFAAFVTLGPTEVPRTLTAADKATLKFDSGLPYMGSGEDLYPALSDTNPGLIGINQHAMLGFPTEQMPPHTGPNHWLMYAHRATGATSTVWKQDFTGLTANTEYQFSVLVSNALTPGLKDATDPSKPIYEPTVRLKVQEGTGTASTMTNAEVTIPLEAATDGDYWKRLVGTFTPTGTEATVSIEVTAGNDSATSTEFDLLGLTDVSLKSCTATTGGSGGSGSGSGSGGTGGTGGSGSGSGSTGGTGSGSGGTGNTGGNNTGSGSSANTGGGGGGGGGALGGLLLGLLGLGAVRRRRR